MIMKEIKDIYEKPIAEFEEFKQIDVITASETDDNNEPWPF